jgi:hypothetical protein
MFYKTERLPRQITFSVQISEADYAVIRSRAEELGMKPRTFGRVIIREYMKSLAVSELLEQADRGANKKAPKAA